MWYCSHGHGHCATYCCGCSCHTLCGVAVMVIVLCGVVVMMAVIAHGAIALVIVITSSWCRNSLLYKGSEDDDGLGVEVTGCGWNKRTKTKTMMMATRMRVKGSMVAG